MVPLPRLPVGHSPGLPSLAPTLIGLVLLGGSGLAAGADPWHPLAPRITVPEHGAAVWGPAPVQVAWSEDPADPPAEIVLLADGRPLAIRLQDWVPGEGLHRALAEVPARTGWHQLQPVLRWRDGRTAPGPQVAVGVLAPGPALEFAAAKPPGGVLNGSKDEVVQGIRSLAAYGGGDLFSLPVEVASRSAWQVMALVRSTPTQGGWPVVEIGVDGKDPTETGGQAAFSDWTRMPIGRPVVLDPGSHQLTVRFANDGWAGDGHDRNLWLGPVEIRPVPGWSEPCDDQAGARWQPLRLAWQAIPAEVVGGAVDLPLRLWWEGNDKPGPVPITRLLVDGVEVSRQVARVPKFTVPAGILLAGRHQIEAEAIRADGTIDAVRTTAVPLTIESRALPQGPLPQAAGGATAAAATAAAATTSAPAGRWSRLGALDPAWNAAERVAVAASPEREILRRGRIAAPWSGPTRLRLDGRTVPGSDGKAVASGSLTVALIAQGSVRELGAVTVHDWGGGGDLPVVDLPEGAWLRLGGDAGLEYLSGEPVVVDTRAPSVALRWPLAGTAVSGGTVLVADVADDLRVMELEALVDGQPTGLVLGAADRLRQTVPVVVRTLSPGEHRLALRVRDGAGATSDSAEVVVRVEDPASALTSDPLARAVRILDRLGYGPDPVALGDLLVDGPERWLQRQVSDRPDSPLEERRDAALAAAAATYPDPANGWEVENRVLQDALLTPAPVEARLQWFLRNHFSVWIGKVEGFDTWQAVLALRSAGASFHDALIASSRSPAMLRYLDQVDSKAGAINENYARELLELHTLGVHGGYAQADVTALAHILAGWSAPAMGADYGKGIRPRRGFAFDPTLAEEAGVTLLGVAIATARPEDRFARAARVVGDLARLPATATFVGGKLADHLGLQRPDARQAVIAAFARSGGDLGACLMAALPHLAAEAPRLAHATDFALALGRALGTDAPWAVMDLVQASGASPFGRLTPDGYPEDDAAHVDSNAMLQRMRHVDRLSWALADLMPKGRRWTGVPLTPEEASTYADWFALRLAGQVLPPKVHAAAVASALTGEGDRDARIRRLVQAVALSPLIQLR